MIVSRVLQPDSKLATARSLDSTSLAGMLGVEGADEDELYAAMDWMLARQPGLEAALARRHLSEGGLVLYDLTSVYLEVAKCELARRGYSRDGKRGLPQIEFGIITNGEGCPVGVERAFRTLKSVDLQVRPVYHRLADRVRAHIFICLLAYYVRWHLERKWASLLYRDEPPPLQEDPVAPAQRSTSALEKARAGRRPDGTPVYSFRGLLVELATLTKNRIRLPGSQLTFEKLALPTPIQAEAFRLLGLSASL